MSQEPHTECPVRAKGTSMFDNFQNAITAHLKACQATDNSALEVAEAIARMVAVCITDHDGLQ